ncbi:MAG: hypothetical protein AAFP98_06530 [Pseudomonadota bacterium]
MTPFPLIKVATVMVLTGSLSGCVVPFVMLPVPVPQEAAGVEPVGASGSTGATITAEDRRERRDRRDERRTQLVTGSSQGQTQGFSTEPDRNDVEDDADRDGGQTQGDPIRPERNDAEDDEGRDGGQAFNVDLGL